MTYIRGLKRISGLSALLLAVSLSANCAVVHDHSETARATSQPQSSPPRKTMKPGANIAISGTHQYIAAEYSQIQLPVSFSTGYQHGQATITALNSQHFSLSQQQWVLDLSTQPLSINVPVSTQAAGRHHLIFNIQVEHNSKIMQRSLGVILLVGEQAEIQQKPSTGRELKLMPAQETVITH